MSARDPARRDSGAKARFIDRPAEVAWRVPIDARREARTLARALGFSTSEATIVATIVSELARSILHAAERGEMFLEAVTDGSRAGLWIIARYRGVLAEPAEGTPHDHGETLESLGVGVAGVRRLADDFHVVARDGADTVIAVTKRRA